MAQADFDYDKMIEQAMAVAAAGDGARAISILEDVVAAEPELAKAHWLLAAEYAQCGRTADAELHFVRVLALDPTLPVARFQLGLLQLTCGQALHAAQTWGGLDLLPSSHPLVYFKNGMLYMAKGELDLAAQTITAGLAAQPEMAQISADMMKMLKDIGKDNEAPTQTTATQAAFEQKKEAPVYDEEQVAVLLSRYREDSV